MCAMRTPRSVLLQPHVAFHKMWQAHDHQHLLADPITKRDYLDQLFRFKPRAAVAGVRLHAFCLMDNHVHECGSIGDELKPFSDWMRVAHGTFGQRFNKRNGRRGKIAIERPKTVVLEDDRAILQVMLYLDANPVVAGLVDDAADWAWSSHRFYAFGEVNAWTRHLDPPEAYLSLGETPKERQRAYRDCYEAYVQSRDDVRTADDDAQPQTEAAVEAVSQHAPELASRQVPWLPGDPSNGDFFGSVDWIAERRLALGSWLRHRRQQRARDHPQHQDTPQAA